MITKILIGLLVMTIVVLGFSLVLFFFLEFPYTILIILLIIVAYIVGDTLKGDE